MPALIHANLKTGMQFGNTDIGTLAWTIRWKTAGWSQRNNMDVWIHSGLFADLNNDGVFKHVEMLTSLQETVETRYLGAVGGNPIYTPTIGAICSYAIRLEDFYGHPHLGEAYCRLILTEAMKNGGRYDYAYLIKSFFGANAYFGTNKDLACIELTWNVIAGIERLFGYRMTYTGQLFSNGQRGSSDFWPVNRITGKPVPYTRFGFNSDSYACWNYTADFLYTPLRQQTYTSAWALRHPRSYFVTP